MSKPLETIPKVEIDLCIALEGKSWYAGERTIRFQETEKRGKIVVVPYPSGIEAYAYRVIDQNGALAFLKLYKNDLKNKRLRRLEWLISQKLWNWDESFRGAPREWVSTQQYGRPHDIDRDFGGVWLTAVPGSTWHHWKSELESSKVQWADHIRTSLARQLIRSLAVLERVGITHGDISDKNVLIDVDGDNAKLYLIDFDGFVLRSVEKCGLLRRWCVLFMRQLFNAPMLFQEEVPTLASEYCRLTVEENGTIGTRNYAPPELMKAFDERRYRDLAPTTDSHARDVLLVELLCWGKQDCIDESPLDWEHETRKTAAGILRTSSVPLSHLVQNDLLELAPKTRPTSLELTAQVGISLPVSTIREKSFKADSPKNRTPLQKTVSFAFLLFVIFLAYRFHSKPDSNSGNVPVGTTHVPVGTTHSQPSDSPLVASKESSTNSNINGDTSKVQPSPLPDSPKRNDGQNKDAPPLIPYATFRRTPPSLPPPEPPPDLGYLELNNPITVPGWKYVRTYKHSFFFQTTYSMSGDPRYPGFDMSEDGSRLGVMRSDGDGCVIDTVTNKIAKKISHGGGTTYYWGKLDLAPDGSFVALGRDLWRSQPFPEAVIAIEYAAVGIPRTLITSPTLSPYYFAISRNGKIVAYADGKRQATIVDLTTSNKQTIQFPPDSSEYSDARVGQVSISDDGSLVAIGKYETVPMTVEVSVFATDSLKRVWHELRKVKGESIFIPKCSLSANGEFLFVPQVDEKRFQCTHLPTQRTVYSPEIEGSHHSLVEPHGADTPIVYGFSRDYDFTTKPTTITATFTKWNPTQDATITKHEISAKFETIIVSANGGRLAMLHSDSGTISFYEAE